MDVMKQFQTPSKMGLGGHWRWEICPELVHIEPKMKSYIDREIKILSEGPGANKHEENMMKYGGCIEDIWRKYERAQTFPSPSMTSHSGILWSSKYEGNMKECVENMKENEEICVDILDLALPHLYGPWGLEKFRFLPLYMGLQTWKNSTPKLPSELWNLEKFQALPLYRLI